MVVADEASRCAMEAADEIKEEDTEVMLTAITALRKKGESRRGEPAREIRWGMLVLWQERPQGERVLEEVR